MIWSRIRSASKGALLTRILIAEDERGITTFLTKGLHANGFTSQVTESGAEAAAMARDRDFDLLILDLGLPDMDGHEVLAAIRGRGERLPVIILTARTGTHDTVSGLEGGADDYVTKPFSFDELLARIRLRLRPSRDDPVSIVRAGRIELDLRTRQVAVDGRNLDLTAREFTLLETLMRHPGHVLSREQLLSHVWGYDFDPGSNVVDVHIRNLRKKVGPDEIETLRGMGYRLRT